MQAGGFDLESVPYQILLRYVGFRSDHPQPKQRRNMKHNWKFIGRSPHNWKYWYKCEKCGASDWVASYGARDQLLPEECNPPTSPQQQGETQ